MCQQLCLLIKKTLIKYSSQKKGFCSQERCPHMRFPAEELDTVAKKYDISHSWQNQKEIQNYFGNAWHSSFHMPYKFLSYFYLGSKQRNHFLEASKKERRILSIEMYKKSDFEGKFYGQCAKWSVSLLHRCPHIVVHMNFHSALFVYQNSQGNGILHHLLKVVFSLKEPKVLLRKREERRRELSRVTCFLKSGQQKKSRVSLHWPPPWWKLTISKDN